MRFECCDVPVCAACRSDFLVTGGVGQIEARCPFCGEGTALRDVPAYP